MDTTGIAEILEKTMIDAVAENLENIVTVTDMGICLDGKKEVYRTYLSLTLNVKQDTPVEACRSSVDPAKLRALNDKERLRLLACELLGI